MSARRMSPLPPLEPEPEPPRWVKALALVLLLVLLAWALAPYSSALVGGD